MNWQLYVSKTLFRKDITHTAGIGLQCSRGLVTVPVSTDTGKCMDVFYRPVANSHFNDCPASQLWYSNTSGHRRRWKQVTVMPCTVSFGPILLLRLPIDSSYNIFLVLHGLLLVQRHKSHGNDLFFIHCQFSYFFWAQIQAPRPSLSYRKTLI